jgi:predicted RNA-binding protein with PUA-like domain
MRMRHWLMKTEPSEFSIDDLQRAPQQTAPWDGVRNYQSRNHMRDGMKLGDRVLFYHSSTDPLAIVGTARIVREAYPDKTAWNKKSPYYDKRSTPNNTAWVRVDLQFESKFAVPVSLAELRTMPALKDMLLLRRGMRLSIQPVTPEEFEAVLSHAARLAQGNAGR